MEAYAGTDLTLSDLIQRQAGVRPDHTAILAPGQARLTYADLVAQQQSAYAQLRSYGVARTDRLALITDNGPGAATAFLYLTSACSCAPLNPAYKAEELEFYLRDLGARFVVTSHPPDAPAQAAARRLKLPVIRLAVDGASCHFESAEGGAVCKDGPPSGEDIALLLHTSGTTAKPKLVPLLQRNLCVSARHVAGTLALAPEDRCLNIMPLFHIHGLVAAVLATLGAGGSVVCTDGAYSSGFFPWLDAFSPSWYTAVPAMHMGILAKAREHAAVIAARPLRFIRSSSSALPPQVLHELEAVFHVPVVEAYGMTEAAHQVACNPLPPATRKPGSVGPPAGPEVAIMDGAGALLGPGATGEVVIRGPNVTPGYLADRQANRSAFANGWFRTGDQGRIDPNGYLFLTGRIKEIINRGGEKVSPREIDEVLLDHPEVEQALAFAVPHVQLGDEIAAAVVLTPGARASESALRRFAATRLAAFKVPRLIRILPEIPTGPTGKPQRIGLAATLGIATIDADQPAAEYRAPESPLERQICGLWQDMLQRDRVGTGDTFVSLGGDSLLAAQMLAAVGEATGAASTFADFLEQGTIAALAREIERYQAHPSATGPIVALRATGSKTPLVCLAGHDGILIGLSRLAELLDPDRAVYALEPPRPTSSPEDGWSIESIAARYADALVAHFEKRPIHLAGVCFGGVTAYEIARQLAGRGAAVQSLILMDTLNPQWQENLGTPSCLFARGVMLLERGEGHLKTLWENRWRTAPRYLSQRFRVYVARRREDAALRRLGDATDSARADVPLLRRLAASSYRPGPYSGRITLIRVRGLRPNPPLMGWTDIASGGVSLKEVEYCPRGMLADPAVATVARLVSEIVA